jgi:hypothetical protein
VRHVGLTDRAVATICRRHRQGEGYRRIAHDFGVHWLTVKYHVKRGDAMGKRSQVPRTNQLSLFSVRPYPQAAITRQNQRRYEASAQAQLARCERLLAQEPTEVIRFRRCEICQGCEDTSQPHQHGRAA